MTDLKTAVQAESHQQEEELARLSETVKQEIQRKYHDELQVLMRAIVELKQRIRDELTTKDRELKQLHLQHQFEKAQIEELAHKQRRAFAQEKEQLRKRHEGELKAMEEDQRKWRQDYKQRHSGEVKQLTQLLSQSYQQIKDPVTSENLRAVAKISSEIVELTKKASGSPFRNT